MFVSPVPSTRRILFYPNLRKAIVLLIRGTFLNLGYFYALPELSRLLSHRLRFLQQIRQLVIRTKLGERRIDASVQQAPPYTPTVQAETTGYVGTTLRASLSGTFFQALPDLIPPLKGHSLSPRSSPPTRSAPSLSPFLTGRMFVRPNILRTLRRTMIRFLIEHLVRRIWFGQSRLYFILNWLVMRCKLRPELAADAQQTA